MILLDTNVISETWKLVPDRQMVAWLDAQVVGTLYLSAITVAELRFGIAAMPPGKRQAMFSERLERQVLPLFAGRILPFDLASSQAYSELMVRARLSGRAIGHSDGYIAATAAANDFAVATRDTSPFEAAGLRVINPWTP